jgi:predicted PurR-regulated permease PerM
MSRWKISDSAALYAFVIVVAVVSLLSIAILAFRPTCLQLLCSGALLVMLSRLYRWAGRHYEIARALLVWAIAALLVTALVFTVILAKDKPHCVVETGDRLANVCDEHVGPR